MKPSTSRLLGYLDPALIAMLVAAPLIFRLPSGPLAVSWAAAILIAALGAMTDYRFGVARALDLGGLHAFHVGIALALGFAGALCSPAALLPSCLVLLAESAVVLTTAILGLVASIRSATLEAPHEA